MHDRTGRGNVWKKHAIAIRGAGQTSPDNNQYGFGRHFSERDMGNIRRSARENLPRWLLHYFSVLAQIKAQLIGYFVEMPSLKEFEFLLGS
jgi:hypothetical protein